MAACDLEDGGGGGREDANLGGVLATGDGDLDESGDGDRRTLDSGDLPRPGDIDKDRLGPGVGDGVLGIVLLLGDVEGEVGLRGDMLYGERSGDLVGQGDNPVGTGLNDEGCGLGEDPFDLMNLQKSSKSKSIRSCTE